MYTSGACSGYGTLPAGPRLVYALSLGNASLPIGGTLVLSTCGLTLNDTVVFAGLGCPTWATPFQCQRGNDNAGDVPGQAACGAYVGASTVTIAATTSRDYFIQIGGRGGVDVTSGLTWSYAPPTPSATPSRSIGATRTRTPMATRTKTATRTRSATSSRSRTRKAK